MNPFDEMCLDEGTLVYSTRTDEAWVAFRCDEKHNIATNLKK